VGQLGPFAPALKEGSPPAGQPGAGAPAPKTDPDGLDTITRLRQAAARTASKNHLKVLGLGLLAMNDVYKGLPPHAQLDKDTGRPLLSWRVAVLPFIEHQELWKRFRLDEPWDSPHNLSLLPEMPATFRIDWGTPPPKGHTHYQVVVGPSTAFERRGLKQAMPFGDRGWFLKDDFPDGLDRTVLVVEAKEAVPWTKPEDLTYDPRGPLPKLGGPFPGLANAAFADGNGHAIRTDADAKTLRALLTRNGGETVGDEWKHKE
jgi:hypothetical protein